MRTVFSSHAKCAHVWAAQTQAEGRSGPLFFRDSTIYSYGGHYPIATFVAPDLVLFNDTSSSRTTSGKHKPAVHRALYGGAARVIRAPIAPTNPMRDIVAALVAEHTTRQGTAARSRKYAESNLERADSTRADIEYLCTRFDLPLPELPAFDRAAILARCAAQKVARAAEDAAQEARNIERDRIRALEYTERVALWRKGGNPYLGDFHNMPTALRVSADGASIETSRGASVPIADARRLWTAIERAKRDNTQLLVCDTRVVVGSFDLRRIEADGTAIVGCHTLEYSETLALASAQGWAT